MIRFGCDLILFSPAGFDCILSHKSSYPVLPANKTLSTKFSCDPWRAVDTPSLSPDLFDPLNQATVFFMPLAQTASEIRIISAPADSQNTAHPPHPKPGAVPLYKKVLHLGCFEKMANAFFKIARSSSKSAIFFFSLKISSSWASCGLYREMPPPDLRDIPFSTGAACPHGSPDPAPPL